MIVELFRTCLLVWLKTWPENNFLGFYSCSEWNLLLLFLLHLVHSIIGSSCFYKTHLCSGHQTKTKAALCYLWFGRCSLGKVKCLSTSGSAQRKWWQPWCSVLSVLLLFGNLRSCEREQSHTTLAKLPLPFCSLFLCSDFSHLQARWSLMAFSQRASGQ